LQFTQLTKQGRGGAAGLTRQAEPREAIGKRTRAAWRF
jgi:hypothetical protein